MTTKKKSKTTKKKELVIVEAPGKVSKIQKYLGSKYHVMASVGHIMDLPPRKLGIDIDNGFKPTYQILDNKEDVVDNLKRAAKKASKVHITVDPDREGEFIGYSIAKYVKPMNSNIDRVVFTEITKKAIIKAFKNSRSLDQDLVRAQQARRILDRLVGFKISPTLWANLQKGLSAGRVQSVGLKMIVDRQKEIDKFKPEKYWTIQAELKNSKGENFVAQVAKKIKSKEEAEKIVEQLKKAKFVIDKVQSKQQKRNPYPPFNTPNLQRSASTILGWKPKKTMQIAQQLYQAGLCTYLRTDSYSIAAEAVKDARDKIAKLGSQYLPSRAQKYKSKASAQEAHECIRPTDLNKSLNQIKGTIPADQYKQYELVYRRLIASQMNPALYDNTKVTIKAGNIKLEAKGQVIVFDGYTKVWNYRDKKKDEIELPELKEKEEVTKIKVASKEHSTKPPARYNSSSLIKELDNNGVGRPSTYQSIIDTLLNRGYVTEQGKAFVPTEIGIKVSDYLTDKFARIVDVAFTADMEERLDKVAKGELKWKDVVEHFWTPIDEDIKKAFAQTSNENEYSCDECNAPLVRRTSKYGPFYACSNCKKIYNIGDDDKPVEKKIEKLDKKCPECGGALIKRTSRTGNVFYGCENFKKKNCRVTADSDGNINTFEGPEKSGKKCEKCGRDMIVRTGPRGKFLGCAGYPHCKNTKSVK